MTTPVQASTTPFSVEVKAGKTYFWCACGRSQKQPFCDGSHKNTDFNPVKFEAPDSKTLYFCGCKQTSTPPLCDGTHNSLQD